jgi:general secretion pathway protein E
MRLADILVENGSISAATAAEALREKSAETALSDWLVQRQLCSETDLLQAWGQQLNLPVVATISDELLDSTLVANLPVDWARTRCLLPIRLDGKVVVVTANPDRLQDQDDLALLLGFELGSALSTTDEIRRAIERCYYRKESGTGEFLKSLESASAETEPQSTSEDLLRVSDSAPVSQLINMLLLDAMKIDASDVHIEPYQKVLRIRFRIDGILYERAPPPKHMEAALVSRLKVMAHLDIAEKRMPQDGTARVRVGEREIDIRVSTVPVADGERLVLRLLNREATLLPLADLGLAPAMQQRFRALLKEPFGVVWVTGPTGSGKTTTLYAALQELDTQHLNVITIEDPVEYQLPTISQIGVKPKIGLTFARGLRHILRQDPDVILVGETRDAETAEIVVRSSLTGHLVFSTLHTNDAISAPLRLMDMGIEAYLVAAATRAVMAQRLVRKLCPHCRQEIPMTGESARQLGSRAAAWRDRPVWAARGCDRCTAGYKGRIGIFELIEWNGALQDLVREGANLRQLRDAVKGIGTLLDDGLEKSAAGETSVEEVLRVVGQADDAHV